MARKLRVQFPGAIYHILNRGYLCKSIFRGDPDRLLFLETLLEACAKTQWYVRAWCLMSNHIHLVVETPQANVARRLRAERMVSLKWIATRLRMGTWMSLNYRLYWERRAGR